MKIVIEIIRVRIVCYVLSIDTSFMIVVVVVVVDITFSLTIIIYIALIQYCYFCKTLEFAAKYNYYEKPTSKKKRILETKEYKQKLSQVTDLMAYIQFMKNAKK
jgi:hypothetical protein